MTWVGEGVWVMICWNLTHLNSNEVAFKTYFPPFFAFTEYFHSMCFSSSFLLIFTSFLITFCIQYLEGVFLLTLALVLFICSRLKEYVNRIRIFRNGIWLAKLFWLTVRKNCSSDREKLLKFETEGWEFANYLRSLEQFIETMKGQNSFW